MRVRSELAARGNYSESDAKEPDDTGIAAGAAVANDDKSGTILQEKAAPARAKRKGASAENPSELEASSGKRGAPTKMASLERTP
jgi:hypothetical protein